MSTLTLSGSRLSLEALSKAALGSDPIAFEDPELTFLEAQRARVDAAVAEGKPIYGVTTGLGSRATEVLPEEILSQFSYETIQGRAHAVGPLLPRELVRAALIVRLNTFLIGASGVSPKVVRHLADVLNSGLVPAVGTYGSIGAADLLLGASAARACLGLGGEMVNKDGSLSDAATALRDVGLTPPDLGPRDGLALANHTCFSATASAMAIARADAALTVAVRVCALSMIGFQANIGPLSKEALSLRRHDADSTIGEEIIALLDGSEISDPANARRLQDPISFRNAAQSFGSLREALSAAQDVVLVEINGSNDNPAIFPESGEILSTGNYFSPHLTRVCTTLSQSFTASAVLSLGRIAKLSTERLSGLPQYLADPEVGTNGLAPVLKLAESLLAGIHKAAQPPSLWPSVNADGVEDALTHSFQAARDLDALLDLFDRLKAIEAIAAAQACDLRKSEAPSALKPTYETVRRASPYLRESRPLGEEIETLANAFRATGQIGETHD